MIEALISDYLSTTGVFAAASAPAAGRLLLGQLLRGRAEAAREILLDEFRKGKKTSNDLSQEEAAAIILRYFRAAQEGAARRNLKLLASLIVGLKADKGFYANEFLTWSDILATLRQEEIVILAVAHRQANATGYQISRDGNFWIACKKELLFKFNMQDLIAESYAAALLRTGLIQLLGGLFDMGHAFLPSPLLQTVAEMADFESHYMTT